MLEQIKKAFTSRAFRVGGYSIVLTAVALAIVIVVNMVASFLPDSWMQIDTTANKLYSISSQSEKVLAGLGKDVTLYWISQTDEKADMLGTLLNQYEGATKHIEVEEVDPDKDPTFIEKYNLDSVSNNSVVAVCGDRFRLVANADIFQSGYTDEGDVTYTFNGESEITSAIHYVSSDNLPKAYILTGHNEDTFTDTYSTALSKDNVETADLNLTSAGSVPEDADLVIINAPKSDISENELNLLSTYLENGGNLFCVSQPPTDAKLTNFEALLADYGVTFQDGIVLDGNSDNCLYGYSEYLLPDINDHEITEPLISANYCVLMPWCRGINIGETPENIEITSLLSTSEDAYLKLLDAEGKLSTDEKEDGDVSGTFSVGVAITADNGNSTSKIVCYTGYGIMSDEINYYVSGGNEDLILNSIGWMVDSEENIAIRSKTIDDARLTINTTSGNAISILIVFIIPAATIGCGIAIAIRRKRK